MPRKIISCPACNARFDVGRFAPGSRVKCGRCEQILTVPDGPGGAPRGKPSFPGRSRAPSKPNRPSRAPVAPRKRPVAPSRRPAAPRPANDIPPPKKAPLSSRSQAPVTTSVGGVAVPDRDPLLGAVINGVFRIVRKLGEGGYGAVYEAKDINLERRVAIKVMLPSRAKNREYVTKFLREARTAAQLVHPNVVAVHSVGYDQDNAIHFLAMEYVEGRTIHDILQERGPLPVDEAIDFIVQSCRGLAAAHDRNIIHRDIKPGNLMLTPKGVIKIADFGLAKIYDAEAAKSTVIGTPYFMPPEQFEGKAKDGRTDIYALGVTFYYMLTMQRPHTGSGPAQILLSVMTKEPKSVLEHRPDLPEGIWPIVQRMIHRDPDSRYRHCVDIIRDLDALRGGGEGDDDSEQIYCPDCGSGNPIEASACSACGTSLLEKCPKCGAEDMAGTKFCGDCGANIPLERAVAALLDEAQEFLEHGRIEKAREKLGQANDRSPENDRLGDLLDTLADRTRDLREKCDGIRGAMVKGDLPGAAKLLQEGRTAYPESAELATLALEIGDVEPAHADGGDVTDSLFSAQRLETEGRYREALVAWQGLLVLDRSNQEAREGEARVAERVNRAESLSSSASAKLADGNPEEALAELEEAATLLPDDPLIEGRLESTRRLAEELRNELQLLENEIESGGSSTLLPRLRALAARFPGAKDVAEAVARAESANAAQQERSREASRERLKQLVAQAVEAESAGRLREAISAYREAVGIDSDDENISEGLTRVRRQIAEFDAVVNQARDLLESGDPEEAEARIRDALEIIPGDPAAQTQKARIRSALETMRYEAERIRNALADDPDEDVLSWAQELANRFPGSALAATVLKEAGAAFQEAEQKAAQQQVEKTVARAEKLEKDGKIPAAIAAFRQALDRLPDHAAAKDGVSRLEQRLSDAEEMARDAAAALSEGDPYRAQDLAEKSLELLPNEPGPAATLAEARTARGEIDRAEKSFQNDVPLDLAERQLERLQHLAEKFPAATACQELVSRAEEVLEEVRSAEAHRARQERLDEARAELEAGRLELAEDRAGVLLEQNENDADARAILDAVVARRETAVEALARGEAAVAEERFEEALAAFDEALEADPELERARTAREAAETERATRERALDDAVAAAREAAAAGDPRAALTAWQAVLALSPFHEEAGKQSAAAEQRLEAGQAALESGREKLDAGDPEHAAPTLREAREALGADEELDALIARADEEIDTIARRSREIGTALEQDGGLEDVVQDVDEFAARFPGSSSVQKLAERVRQTAADRRRTQAGAIVRSLIEGGRYAEALTRVAELRKEGVNSPELAAAEKDAEKAQKRLEERRSSADEARESGDLDGALAILTELVEECPSDEALTARVEELTGVIREVSSRREAAAQAERRGDLNEAKVLYSQAHDLNPGSGELTSELTRLDDELKQRRVKVGACTVALTRGDGAACVASAAAILERYPDDEDALDLKTAGEGLEAAVEALLRRAERQITLQDQDGASETVELVLRIAPQSERAEELRKGLAAESRS